MTEPKDTQVSPDLNDPTEQYTEGVPGAAEAPEATSEPPQEDVDDETYIPRRSVRQRLAEAAVWGALLFGLIGASVLTLIVALKHPSQPPVQTLVKGPIDGTYRVDRYQGEGTTRTPDGKVSTAAPQHNAVETEWWAFQSACQPPSCTAIGTRLDDTSHTQIAARLAPNAGRNMATLSLRLVNGQWVSDPPNRVLQDCAAGMPGHERRRFTIDLAQLADGTLKGQESDLVESNECNGAGTVVTTPIVVTRIADLPAGLPPMRTR